jgi:uncharacterized membrane-anchored protein
MNTVAGTSLSKVREVTLGFWIVKIAATTLGETGGDTVTGKDLAILAIAALFLMVALAAVALTRRARAQALP